MTRPLVPAALECARIAFDAGGLFLATSDVVIEVDRSAISDQSMLGRIQELSADPGQLVVTWADFSAEPIGALADALRDSRIGPSATRFPHFDCTPRSL